MTILATEITGTIPRTEQTAPQFIFRPSMIEFAGGKPFFDGSDEVGSVLPGIPCGFDADLTWFFPGHEEGGHAHQCTFFRAKGKGTLR